MALLEVLDSIHSGERERIGIWAYPEESGLEVPEIRDADPLAEVKFCIPL